MNIVEAMSERTLSPEELRKLGEGGSKADAAKPAVELVPYELVQAAGRAFAYGEHKYAAQNWRKGISTRRLLGSVIRHAMKFASGEEWDQDAASRGWQVHHLDMLAASVAMLVTTYRRRPDLDDRAIGEGMIRFEEDELVSFGEGQE
mgnify:CR=1 FL=1